MWQMQVFGGIFFSQRGKIKGKGKARGEVELGKEQVEQQENDCGAQARELRLIDIGQGGKTS